jgi:hypothetical protein
LVGSRVADETLFEDSVESASSVAGEGVGSLGKLREGVGTNLIPVLLEAVFMGACSFADVGVCVGVGIGRFHVTDPSRDLKKAR